MWWTALLGAAMGLIGSAIGQALVALGIGVVTYTGVEASISFLKAGFLSSVSGLPAEAVGMLALMQVGSCISMVISAIAIKLGLTGMTSGTVKKWVKR